jgi:predicted GNAT family acetyltransferase
MNYKYYSYCGVVARKGSDTEKICNALCILVPEMKKEINVFHEFRSGKHRLVENGQIKMFATGLYVMRNADNKIVCVASIAEASIRRIITLPQYRRQGFATHLIKHIADKMIETGLVFVNAPVSPHAEPLFKKLGWVKRGKPNEDGTQTFCPPSAVDMNDYSYTVDISDWIRHLASTI